jgi:hypothetical protein
MNDTWQSWTDPVELLGNSSSYLKYDYKEWVQLLKTTSMHLQDFELSPLVGFLEHYAQLMLSELNDFEPEICKENTREFTQLDGSNYFVFNDIYMNKLTSA